MTYKKDDVIKIDLSKLKFTHRLRSLYGSKDIITTKYYGPSESGFFDYIVSYNSKLFHVNKDAVVHDTIIIDPSKVNVVELNGKKFKIILEEVLEPKFKFGDKVRYGRNDIVYVVVKIKYREFSKNFIYDCFSTDKENNIITDEFIEFELTGVN